MEHGLVDTRNRRRNQTRAGWKTERNSSRPNFISCCCFAMPKLQVSAFARVKEFPGEKLYVSDKKILMCLVCECRLNHDRKDTVVKHIGSEKHIARKARAALLQTTRRQATISEAYSAGKKAKDDKEDFIINTTQAFISANIPVEKLDHPVVRQWLHQYVKGSGDLPSANRIRQHYIPIVGERKEAEIKEAICGKRVCVLSDETTDKRGLCVFNVLFRTVEPGAKQDTFLAASVVLDAANGHKLCECYS